MNRYMNAALSWAIIGLAWLCHRMVVCARKVVPQSLQGELGQGMAEYALIIAFLSILVIIATKLMQPNITSTLNTVANYL